jgi:hypothetical protein
MRELRLYTFINFYLSSIQQGIQTAHIVHELFNKYKFSSQTCALHIDEWALNHKTIIVCNGGGTIDLKAGIAIAEASQYAWAPFYESGDCLSGALTGFGIILPEVIFSCRRSLADVQVYETIVGDAQFQFRPFVDRDWELIDYVVNRPLAR